MTVEPRETEHVRQQRPLGIETSSLDDRSDASQRKAFYPSSSFRIQFPSDPHKVSLLPELPLDLVGPHGQNSRQITRDAPRMLNGGRHGIH